MELLIDPEFKNWIMPLRDDEFKGLEENILLYGCTSPLDVWKGILIDGHNRYKICQKHGVIFQVHQMEFASREDAKNYMIRNQLARRNVTPEQRDYLMGKMYHEQKIDRSENLNRDASPKGQNVQSNKSEQIGEQFNVGGKTVQRAEQFAVAVDKLASNCGRDIRDKILSGSVDITKKDVLVLNNMPQNQQQAAISLIRKGMKGKHAIDRVCGDPAPEEEETAPPYTISIPCCNPRCDRHINVTEQQFREFFGVYPEKYSHISIPYCSKACRDSVMVRLQNVQ